MSINVSTSMGFENREFLKNAAKEILQKNGADKEKANEIIQKAVFYPEYETSAGLSALRASTQITLNNSLKETLKYLNAHANDKRKKYVLGELWDILGNLKENEDDKSNVLLDFEIDANAKNIFTAA